jgi:hypothetical protein
MSDELHSPAPLGRFQRITNTLMAACLGVMAVLVFVNVVLRHVFDDRVDTRSCHLGLRAGGLGRMAASGGGPRQ